MCCFLFKKNCTWNYLHVSTLTFRKQCATESESSLPKHINSVIIENLSLEGDTFLNLFPTWQNTCDFPNVLVRH